MRDLIYKEDAIKTILGQYPEPHYPSWYADQIKKMPSVQPERRPGKWILLGCGWAKCSQCGVKHLNAYDDDHWYNFCPHCGAKMLEVSRND